MTNPRSCSSCREALTPDTAPPSVVRKGGYCRACSSAYMRLYYDARRETRKRPCQRCGRMAHGGMCATCGEVADLQRRSKRCKTCDAMFTAATPVIRHCSQECRRKQMPAKYVAKVCSWCFVTFTTTTNRVERICCSRECQKTLKTHYERWRQRDRCAIPQCIQCGAMGGFDPVRRDKCDDCFDLISVVRRGQSEARRRDAVRTGDRITLSALMSRDDRRCHLCGGTTYWSKGPLHDKYPTIDHLVPISQGGTHTWDNVALAHRGCNLRRGVHGEVQLRLT